MLKVALCRKDFIQCSLIVLFSKQLFFCTLMDVYYAIIKGDLGTLLCIVPNIAP